MTNAIRAAIAASAAREFWVVDWSYWQEEHGWPDGYPGGNLSLTAPPTPAGHIAEAEKWLDEWEASSGFLVAEIAEQWHKMAADDRYWRRPSDAGAFGFYAAHQATGSGCGLWEVSGWQITKWGIKEPPPREAGIWEPEESK